MYHFLIIFCLIINTSAKIYHQNGGIGSNGADDLDTGASSSLGVVGYIIGDPLWVLQLSNEEWLDAKLRLGTSSEQEDFYYVIRPMLAIAQNRPASSRVKKNDPESPTKVPPAVEERRSNSELKHEIMKLINKFALSTSIEPDTYLTVNDDGHSPSIALYFKGPVSSIIVKLPNKQWHYVIETSPFPHWFYERHETFEAPLSIPEEIKNDFFSALLRVLKLMLYHPL